MVQKLAKEFGLYNDPTGVVTVEMINTTNSERMEYVDVYQVFNQQELNDFNFIKRYNLLRDASDYLFIPLVDLPNGYPIHRSTILNGEILTISMRAMHYILLSELRIGGKMHFVKDKFLKWKILDYDNSHGCILKKAYERQPIEPFAIAETADKKLLYIVHMEAVPMDRYSTRKYMSLYTIKESDNGLPLKYGVTHYYIEPSKLETLKFYSR